MPQRERRLDKMPDNFRYCAEIAFLFPNARIVHCRRHPGDTFVSAFQNEMNAPTATATDPETYAAHYASYSPAHAALEEFFRGGSSIVDYERLTADPRQVVGDLLGLPGSWSGRRACLHPEQNTRTVRTFSRLQVRSAINSSSVGRWKNYERHLKPILDAYGTAQASSEVSDPDTAADAFVVHH